MVDDLVAFASRRARTRWAGHPTVLRERTGSTNDDARTAARDGAPHGYLALADVQSAGRGRSGRSWWAMPGCSVLASLVLRPKLPMEHVPLVTLAVGLAVAETVEAFVEPSRVTIKWPNDVRVDSRKVAGVLVEGSVRDGRVGWLVAGVGINVSGAIDVESVTQSAVSLEVAGGYPVTRGDVLERLLARLEARLDGSLDDVAEAMAARCDTLGTQVSIADVSGVATAIAGDGGLVVRGDDGTITVVRAGEVLSRDARGP